MRTDDLQFRTITPFDVFIRRCCAEFTTGFDTVDECLQAAEPMYVILGLIYIPLTLIIGTLMIPVHFFQYLGDSSNPEFDSAKEFKEWRLHSQVHGGKLSMSYEYFCSMGYQKGYEEAKCIIEEALSKGNSILKAVRMPDVAGDEVDITKILSRNPNNIGNCHVTFGNDVNKAVYSLFHSFLLFKKEGRTTYFFVTQGSLERLENELQKMFNNNEIKIKVI